MTDDEMENNVFIFNFKKKKVKQTHLHGEDDEFTLLVARYS